MLFLFATVHTLGIDLITSARNKLSTDGERGSVTLELVAIAAGLLVVATAVVVAITAAVTGRLGGIN